ncbi:hypothetical protein [Streptomyces rochei]
MADLEAAQGQGDALAERADQGAVGQSYVGQAQSVEAGPAHAGHLHPRQPAHFSGGGWSGQQEHQWLAEPEPAEVRA